MGFNPVGKTFKDLLVEQEAKSERNSEETVVAEVVELIKEDAQDC